MEFNFDATNNLIDLLNKHVTSTAPLQHVHVHHNASVEKNADMFISRMDDIQDVIDNIDKKLAEELDPDLYKELNDPNLSFKQRIALAKKAVSATIVVVSSVAGVVLVGLIKTGRIVKGVVTAIGVIKTSAIASLALGVLALGIDMIASAIIGAVERDKLDKIFEELNSMIREFDPCSFRDLHKNCYESGDSTRNNA